ncbi:hypothetical protein EV401DRAFT_2072136 [Pisolithus croceorrhizus]|nr:hypothetical protein EV401DRAFT_2072136 [Pisolithus croceorrhizus]
MFTKTFLSTVAATALFAASASAICPGYKFGITQNGDNGAWQVFDNSCHVVHQVTAKNPCTVGVFDCGSAQSTPTALHLNGQKPMPALVPAMVILFKSAAIDRVKPLNPWTE